jgi:hypothetical protein
LSIKFESNAFLRGRALPMRIVTFVAVVALTNGALGCSWTPTYRTAGGAAAGGAAGVVGGALVAGPVGAVVGGAAGAATGAALVAPREEQPLR